MPQIIKTGGGVFSKGELIRINPNNNTIESSQNGGRSWVVRLGALLGMAMGCVNIFLRQL